MAESVDATDLKSVGRKAVPVRVRARAPTSRELIRRGIVSPDRLYALLEETPVSQEVHERVRAQIGRDLALSIGGAKPP